MAKYGRLAGHGVKIAELGTAYDPVAKSIRVESPANTTGLYKRISGSTVQFKVRVDDQPLNLETGAAVVSVASISKHN